MLMNKKRLLLMIFPLLTFILWQCGCKKHSLFDEIFYDIRGEWTIINHYNGLFTEKVKCTFSGNMDRGAVTPESGEPGKYSVGGGHGDQVVFHFGLIENEPAYYNFYVGHFVDSNTMEGSASWFTWSATRELESN